MDAKQFKQKLLDQLYAPYIKCTMCPLGSLGRTHVVFGEGDTDAKLMFVGEGPGAQEDAQGRPFVGRSGQLLTKSLNALGLERNEVFITNIVKCRPPGNRAPTPLESTTCKNLLLFNQIKIIRPKIICTLGASSLEGLLERPVKITHLRGTIQHINDLTILPTFHPAYILRNQTKFEIFLHDLKTAIEKAYSPE